MFGYVKINKDEMKFKDYKEYKGIYCSLCRELGRNYGVLSKFSLNYDFTFLSVLRLALAENEPCLEDGRCPFNPLIKCKKCKGENEEFRFVTATAIMFLYFKLLDDIDDEAFFKRLRARVMKFLYTPKYKKAKALYPGVEVILQNMLSQQRKTESTKPCADLCAHPSATALGALFAFGVKDEVQREILEKLGYCIGRFVYFTDAYDDYDSDLKSNSFNPFIINGNISSAEQIIAQSVGEGLSMYRLISPNRYNAILENIMSKGLTNSFRIVRSKKGEVQQ